MTTSRAIGHALLACVALACGASPAGQSPAGPSPTMSQQTDYQDPGGRFAFSYPSSFGTTSTGTDNGFGNRVAAVRFSIFSTQGVGGEAVVGQGRPSLDVLTAGGLYDDIARGTLPALLHSAIEAVLPPLTPANFCDQIGREQHIDTGSPAFASLTPSQRTALAALDRMGNVGPRVLRCAASGDAIVFEKEAAVVDGGPRRLTYGAVRFLNGRYSTFQLIRAGGTAGADTLDDIVRVVNSFRVN